MMYTQIGIST